MSSPENLTICAGQAAMFSVSGSETAPLSYQWFYNGATIAGAIAPTSTIQLPQADSGSYEIAAVNKENIEFF